MSNLLAIYPDWLLYSFIAVIGLLFGSFFTMVTWRMPRMVGMGLLAQIKAMSWSRSQCPSCQTDLTPKQLIPLFSWLFYRGRCANCGTRVPSRYFWIELFTGLMTLLPFVLFGFTEKALLYVLLMWFLVLIFVIDIEHQLILDSLSLPLLALGLTVNAIWGFVDIKSAAIGAAAGYLSLWLVFWGFKLATGKEGMGYGDFKLFAALGAWFGWQALSPILLIAALTGIFWGILQMAVQGAQSRQFAFGPFLILGALAILVLQNY
ncbi:prepilin peptidase [Thiomicrorhabdus heinhorstiae]|uniref:Prepilin leader peptidase/N-methyltransferase n=1 Tax=Thiomicrorhabdus heinhorstiae TaxID=2748010 RepID=A0ABS0BU62_9GAMM|nr:A24 family peptidase [Thiomicrorhabdus heinhorstiae]MBF6057371.1 prepilin peptidase [Thiomicrorhabdus heinhorstiae]